MTNTIKPSRHVTHLERLYRTAGSITLSLNLLEITKESLQLFENLKLHSPIRKWSIKYWNIFGCHRSRKQRLFFKYMHQTWTMGKVKALALFVFEWFFLGVVQIWRSPYFSVFSSSWIHHILPRKFKVPKIDFSMQTGCFFLLTTCQDCCCCHDPREAMENRRHNDNHFYR